MSLSLSQSLEIALFEFETEPTELEVALTEIEAEISERKPMPWD